MSGDERAPAQTHEQVRAVLVEMRREDELELQRWERWVQLYATGAIPMPLSDSLEAVQTERDRRAADVAALSAAIDALEDSALLDLMGQHLIEPFWLNRERAWVFTVGTTQDTLRELDKTNPNGWPSLREMLRAAAALLAGKDGGERG